MTPGERVLSVAASQIGYHEEKNHRNKYGAWYGLDGVAWCMEFVQWCYDKADIPLPFKTASCGELLRWYRKHQPECVGATPVPGCIVIFDFPRTAYDTDHTGIFEGMGRETITTVDGNTTGGAGSDANGGWVERRTRALSYANPVFIIPHELEEDDMDIDKLINSLTTEQALALGGKIEAARATLPPSSYAASACKKAIRSGLFTDGNKDGSLDRPRCTLTREDFAVVLDREGELEGR